MYPNSDDPNTPKPAPRPALALVATAVERALRFVVDGRITLATIEGNETNGDHLIIADINPTTKKRSSASVAFSDELWGDSVNEYLQDISGVRKSDLDKIISDARNFSRITRTHEDDDPIWNGPKNSRTRIPLNYDDDDEDEDDDADDDDDDKNPRQINISDQQTSLGDDDEDMDYGDGEPEGDVAVLKVEDEDYDMADGVEEDMIYGVRLPPGYHFIPIAQQTAAMTETQCLPPVASAFHDMILFTLLLFSRLLLLF